MVPSLKSFLCLAPLLACGAPDLAVATPTPTPMLAAAPGAAPQRKADKPRHAERQGQRKRKQLDQPAAEHGRPDAAAKRPAPPSGSAAPPLPACPPNSPLGHRSFGAGFLRTWCTGCHSSTLAADDRQGAPVDVNFDTAALYRPHARAVYERAVLEAAADPSSASPMPPAGVVPEADRRRLAEWIACGSPGT